MKIICSYLFVPLMNKHIYQINKLDGIKELELNTNKFITNKYYSSDVFRKIKLTKIETDTKQIFRSIFIPHINYSAPILTVDCIKHSPKLSTILLNVYTHNITHINNLLDIKYEYLHYCNQIKTNVNDYNKIINKSSLYSIYDDDQINKYCEIFDIYFTSYLKMFEYNPTKSDDNHDVQITFIRNKIKIDLMEYNGFFCKYNT